MKILNATNYNLIIDPNLIPIAINERLYRRIRTTITSTDTIKDTSNRVHLEIYQPSIGGSLTPVPAYVCQNIFVTDTLKGNNGLVQYWEKARKSDMIFKKVPGSDQKAYLKFDTDTAGVFLYRVKVKNGPCDSTYSDTTNDFTVNPKPIGYAQPQNASICAHSQFTINLTSNSPNAMFVWQQNFSQQITGINSSGTGPTITGTPVFKYTPHPDPLTVIFKCIATLNTCKSDTLYVYLTIKDKPVGFSEPPKDTVCSGTQISLKLHSNQASLPATFSWKADVLSSSISGMPQTGITDNISGTPKFLSDSSSMKAIVYKCFTTTNSCKSDSFYSTIVVKPYPAPKSISGEFEVCQQTKLYKIPLKSDEICHWSLSDASLGTIESPYDSITNVMWRKAGEGNLIARVIKLGCEKSFSDTINISTYADPTDNLVKMFNPSSDTLILLCQQHINEVAKDYYFTWGFENKKTGKDSFIAIQSEQCYWVFTAPDTIANSYFVIVSYKDARSCSSKTYYKPENTDIKSTKESFEISPNPNHGNFSVTINHPAKGSFQLILYDLTGVEHVRKKFIKTQEIETFNISVSSTNLLIYIALIRFDTGEILIRKMIVQ